jgi:hypothetical protein
MTTQDYLRGKPMEAEHVTKNTEALKKLGIVRDDSRDGYFFPTESMEFLIGLEPIKTSVEIGRLKDEVDRLNSRLLKLHIDLGIAKRNLSNTEAQRDEADQRAAMMEARNAELVSALGDLRAMLQDCSRSAVLARERRKDKRAVWNMLRNIYRGATKYAMHGARVINGGKFWPDDDEDVWSKIEEDTERLFGKGEE